MGCDPSIESIEIERLDWMNVARFKKAVGHFGALKTPGLDNIQPILLQHLPEIAMQRLVNIQGVSRSLVFLICPVERVPIIGFPHTSACSDP